MEQLTGSSYRLVSQVSTTVLRTTQYQVGVVFAVGTVPVVVNTVKCVVVLPVLAGEVGLFCGSPSNLR